MGRYIDPDQPMSDEDKEFLRGRSRGDEVIENERRFPPDGEPAPHEAAGYMPTKPGYDYQKQADKIEDAGGLQVERIPVDDEGRPMIKEYGYVEGITHESAFDSEIDDDKIAEEQAKEPEPENDEDDDSDSDSEDSDEDDDEGDLDDDILERVLDMEYDDLQKELKELGLKANGTKEDLVDRLANALQDKRDAETVSES